MQTAMTIRPERYEDAAAIVDVIYRAYREVPYSDHREHLMVDRLRASEAWLPDLSFLAEIDGTVVGHILLTKAEIVSASSIIATLALAPLSVVPEYQGRGIGRRLVREAHARAAELGFDSVVLVGIRDHYRQFGYRLLSDYPITLPFEAPAENCMILPLTPGGLDGVAGTVRYAEAWLDH